MIEPGGEVKRIRFPLFLGILGAAALTLAGLSPAEPATKVLSGRHSIVYDIVNPLGVEYIPNYANNSYSQKVLQEDEFSKRVLVEVNLGPLLSTTPFPIPPRQVPGQMSAFLSPEKDIPVNEAGILAQARALAKESRTVHEAVTAVFNWVVDHHTYDAGRDTLQDGRSVFYSRRGSCVGYTNLAIAMLRGLGIPARYAGGYLPPGYDWGISKKYWGVQISGGGYHAWIEVYYPDMGWCFSDLLHSKNFVDPFHVLRYIKGVNLNPRNVQGGSLDVEDATTFTIFQEENQALAIDQLLSPKKDFLARQSGPQQFGTIHGKVKDPHGKPVPKGNLVLWEGGQGKVTPFENGLYSLLGLEDGTYRVTVRAEGYAAAEKSLSVKKGEVRQVDLVLSPQAAPPAKPKAPSRSKP